MRLDRSGDHMRLHPRRTAIAVALASLLLAAAACSNANNGSTGKTAGGSGVTCHSSNETQGVSDTEIKVGGLASHTNPLGNDYGVAWAGTKAYFDMVNAEGGVNGRKFNLANQEDDQVGSNTQVVQRLMTQDGVFAVAPVAALLFTGANLLAQDCVPTFGWNINPQWSAGPSMFGDKGSHLSFTDPSPSSAWITQKLGRKKLAVLAYNIDESTQCATGVKNTYDTYPVANIVYSNNALPYPLTDVAGDVAAMKQRGVDYVTACVDVNGMATIAREMRKQGMNAILYLPDGYYDSVKADPNFTGAYAITFFTPFELPNPPAGLKAYLKWMRQSGGPINEISLAGWVSADMLVTGVKAAGKDVTRSKVVAALNALKDYNANGIIPGIDWTIAHTDAYTPPCAAYSIVIGGQFAPVLGQPGKPFLCFPGKWPAGTSLPDPTYK
jgi:branched-chain amino acid transport system substrate-binding protein